MSFWFFETQYLQGVLGYSPIKAGIAFLPVTLPNFAMAMCVTRLTLRFGNARLLLFGHSDDTLASLLSLSDVMCTCHHAAVSAGVKQGDTVAVVEDGAVGLCAVIAAKGLGAERIIALSRKPARQALAREFGAIDVLAERGDEATEKDTGDDRWHRRGRGARVRRINPGRVFDYTTDLKNIVEAYNAMDERRAVKSLLRIGTV